MMANVRPHSGWMGVFTTDQAPGCWPNGTRIERATVRQTVAHGARRTVQIGTVLGSVHVPEKGPAYFVEWDSMPQAAMLVEARTVRRYAPN
jgi:hypothetical protein